MVVNTGHSSAASFPTGPVMAEPFISPFGLTICNVAMSACHYSISHRALEHACCSFANIALIPISSHFQPTRAMQVCRDLVFPAQIEGRSLTTPALSSKYKYTPSALLHGLLCRTTTAGITFFRSSGFPFLTVAITISPTPAAGRRLRRAPMPLTEMM